MSAYQQFIFKDWVFDRTSQTLSLRYSYDNRLNFEEQYRFDFPFVDYSEPALERAITNLFFMAGVSYYKAYVAPEIVIEKGPLDDIHASFFEQTYQKGLGEFFYKNGMDPRASVVFPRTRDSIKPINAGGNGSLVGLGGGKDSLVSVELLRDSAELATWALNHRSQLEPLVTTIGLPHVWVERTWDPQLEELNTQGAYNGHVPISAIFACVGTVAAILSGKRDAVVSNERSADEATLVYDGVEINHQYSKSSAFEKAYQELLRADFGDSQRYYSLLRSMSELAVADIFSRVAFEKYERVFSSCNRAYTRTSDRLFWCGTCPKCAFVFLVLTPFITRERLEGVFGKNMLLDPTMESMYRQLLGIEGNKPLECVGEIQESRVAMERAKEQYPELAKYVYELDTSYDYQALGPNALPAEIQTTFLSAIQ